MFPAFRGVPGTFGKRVAIGRGATRGQSEEEKSEAEKAD